MILAFLAASAETTTSYSLHWVNSDPTSAREVGEPTTLTPRLRSNLFGGPLEGQLLIAYPVS